MRKPALFILILAMFLFSVTIVEAVTPSPTPAKRHQSASFPSFPTADKPFVWVVTTDTQDINRVGWQILTGSSGAPVGAFNRIANTKWMCYFSGDNAATCGASPLTGTATTKTYRLTMSFQTSQPNLVEDGTIPMSQVSMPASVVYDATNKLAYMLGGGVYDDKNAAVAYKVLSASDVSEIRAGATEYSLNTGFFVDFKTNPLPAGEYFMLFELKRLSDGKQGGSIAYTEISAPPATPTPISQAKTTALEADPVAIDTKANQSETVEFTFRIRNPTNMSATNLTATLPPSISAYTKINFLNESVGPFASADYKIRIPDIQSSIAAAGRFTISYALNGSLSSMEIPLSIKVDIIIPQNVLIESETPLLDVSPSFFSKPVVVGKGAADRITIKNTGKGRLQKLDFELKGIPAGLLKVDLPDEEILSGGQAFADIEFTPPSEQRYTGSLVITSNGGEREIGIDIEAFEDITDKIGLLGNTIKLRQANATGKEFSDTQAKSLLAEAATHIEKAKTDWEAGKYREANTGYQLAESKTESAQKLISSSKPSEGGGLLVPLIIIIILAAAGFFVFKKMRARKGDEYGAEEGGDEERGDEEYQGDEEQ